MKNILPALFLLLCCAVANAQTVGDKFGDSHNPFMTVYDVNGKPLSLANTDIEGTPMLNNNWGKGQVIFASGRTLKDVPLQFNIFSNELCFQKDNTTYAFAEAIKAFRFIYTGDEGGENNVYFQSGYPAVNNNDGNTYYQVLADGQHFQLLKLTSKKIREVQLYNGPLKKEYADVSEYFIYSVQDGKMMSVKMDKSSLASTLTGYETQVNQFAAEKKSKLKKEDDVVELINSLNKS